MDGVQRAAVVPDIDVAQKYDHDPLRGAGSFGVVVRRWSKKCVQGLR